MRPVKKQNIFISIILIIILGFAIYFNSLNGKFIWDDEFLINDNVYIKNASSISKLFTESTGAGAGKKYGFHRPIQMITYLISYALFKLDVKGYHLTNIILHILVALSIYWLISILYENYFLSLFTSMLFIVHPLHTEAVAYISGRADSMVALFMLTCFILYIKHLHSEDIAIYILMLLSYTLALLSRENGFILPALLLLYHYTFKKKILLKQFLPLLGICFFYILLRITLLKSLLPIELYTTTLFQRIPGFFAAITNYTKLLFLPLNLHMEYGYKQFSFTDPIAILGIVILISSITYAFKKRRNTDNLIFFSILWFFVTLLPQSNLYPINAYMAEHWLYLPSIGFFLILGNALNSLYTQKKTRILSICLITGLVTFYSYLTIRQNNYWREPVTFYERTLEYAPNSPRIHNNLGSIYRDMGKRDQAEVLFKKAIAIEPNYAEAHNNLGLTYKDLGKKDQAIALFKKAIAINPNYAKAYNNLGNTYCDMGKKDEAIPLFKKAIEINPDLIEPYNNLGGIYRDMGKKDQAIALFKKAIAINPNLAEIYYNLGNIYNDIDKDQAISLYEKAIAIKPNLAEAYYNLGNIYRDMGKKDEAISLFKKAIAIRPNYAVAYNNLAVIYYNDKQYALAVKHCNRAIELGYNVNLEFLRLLKAVQEGGG